MSKSFVFLFMLFCHVFDDYFLQGCLANLKQKEYWRKQTTNRLYEYDYMCALLMHSISWSFSIMFPIALYNNFNVGIAFTLIFIVNVLCHFTVDNEKANVKSINLWQDQTIHLVQIILTYLILM